MSHSNRARMVNCPSSRLSLAISVILLGISTGCQSAVPVPASTATPSAVQIGPFLLTYAPTLQEQRLSGIPPPPSQEAPSTGQGASYQEATTLADARKLAGFDVWSPGYLPSGYTLQRYTVLVGNGAPALEVSAEYISEDYEQLWYLRQIRYSAKDANNAHEFPVGNAHVVTVMVRGQPGVWVEATHQGAHQTETGEEILVPWNILLWVEGDYFFWFYSSELPLDESLKVAESLTELSH